MPFSALLIDKAGLGASRGYVKGQTMSEREQRSAELAALMPDTMVELLDVAASAIDTLHAAVMAGDQEAAGLSAERYEATIWKLNGGTFFGCVAEEDAAGNLVENHCRAAPGTVPKWGQAGTFLVTAGGIRALVKFGGGIGVWRTHFDFYAVDLDKPFISETGYRAHFDEMHAGQTVSEVAAVILRTYLKEKRRKIKPSYRDLLAKEPLPTWMETISPPPCRLPATLPPGFVLVNVVLPAHKAFIARKWAEQARGCIESKQAKQQEKVEAVEEKKWELVQQEAKVVRLNTKDKEDGGVQA